ncbi:MAG: LysE family transporter [Lentisphaerota bacterium]
MAHLFFLFWSAFLIGFSGAMMPGPVLTATISEVMKRGFKAGPLIVLGHAMLEIVVLILVVAGFGAWITHPLAKAILGLGGGAVLVVMGYQMAAAAGKAADLALHTTAHAESALKGPVLTGILTSLSNPYFALWWATTGLYYAALAMESGLPGLASFYSGHILADLTWYSVVAAAAASGRRICPPSVYKGLIFICGLALVSLGLFFFWGGAKFFAG